MQCFQYLQFHFPSLRNLMRTYFGHFRGPFSASECMRWPLEWPRVLSGFLFATWSARGSLVDGSRPLESTALCSQCTPENKLGRVRLKNFFLWLKVIWYYKAYEWIFILFSTITIINEKQLYDKNELLKCTISSR